jgi:hypothetical protein
VTVSDVAVAPIGPGVRTLQARRFVLGSSQFCPQQRGCGGSCRGSRWRSRRP